MVWVFGWGVFVVLWGVAALGVGAALDVVHIVCACELLCLLKLVGVALVEGVVFGYDSCGFHIEDCLSGMIALVVWSYFSMAVGGA